MMPKGPQRSVHNASSYYRLSPIDTPSTQYATISASRPMPTTNNPYYTSSQGIPIQPSMSQQSYNSASGPSSYTSQGGPVQQPHPQHLTHHQPYPVQLPVSAPQAVSLRPSSGAWTPSDDQTLMTARAQGMNWAPIQQSYFPTKTPNACRKRHERLMERRNADDWDGLKLEELAKNYMNLRREIWSPLAAQTGEKWTVVEQKCMAQGLKNLQTAARSSARRERMSDGTASLQVNPSQQQQQQQQNNNHHQHPSPYNSTFDHPDSIYADDSLEASDPYDGNASDRSYYGGHAHSSSNGSSVGSDMRVGAYAHMSSGMMGSRLPSMDMGIAAIINRPHGTR